MHKQTTLESILFLDIETVAAYPDYQGLSDRMKFFWDKKAEHLRKSEEDTPENLYPRAGIYAEFGKIICISVAYIREKRVRIKSFYGDDEKTLLEDFATLLRTHFNGSHHRLCAHNGKEFDFPYICRRMLIHKIKLPSILDVSGKKPWETTFLDTMEMWRFGDYKQYTSLDLLATLFSIDSPKDDIDGSKVNDCYWKEKALERIKTYCEKDVLTVVQLYVSYYGKNLYRAEDIMYV
ncbi:MAG: 3'-5' exonuclease [Bacteroidales bacterium]|jgi:DNA polymerase elongation subunit (family B)|nr:3'-5' exonuclease [Bacteroidales bacterium]